MRRLRKVFIKVSLSLVVLITIASIFGMADVVKADFSTTPETKLTASDAALYDNFGASVSVSGDTAVVGAPREDSGKGAAYVFVRSGTTWNQQAKLTASDVVSGDYFGTSISFSGDTAMVGTEGNAAYVFVRSGTIWSQQAKLTASDAAADDYFGGSVSLSGDTAVVGANGKDSGRGAAYVFVRIGAAWSQQAKFTASDVVSGDYFGISVSVSGDTAVASASYKDSARGAAYVFVRSGTTWSQQVKLTASDPTVDDSFGHSVSVSGDTAVVGASYKDSFKGAAYVFVRSGAAWSQQVKLTASDPAGGDYFGASVSVSGDTAVVGASGKESNKGTAYVFVRSGAAWSQQVKLTASDAVVNNYFGFSVSVSGDIAVAGAIGDSNKGAAYVYESTPTWQIIVPISKPPSVSTSAATAITSGSATLNGNLTSLNKAATVNVSFEYGTTTSYGSTTAAQSVMGTGAYNVNVTSLTPGTTYHFRAKAEGSLGAATGSDMTFTTNTLVTPTTTNTPTAINTPTTKNAPAATATPIITTTLTATVTPATEENKTQIPLYVWLIAAIGVVIVASVVFSLVRNRKTRKPMVKEQKTDSTNPPQTSTESKHPDYFDMLKKLADLRDQGIITKEEFESKKSEIMRKISGSE